MILDPDGSTPLYKQIIEDINQRIENGDLKAGDRIESNKKLSEKYDVSLITVKKAVSELISEGKLYSEVGKGTFVSSLQNGVKLARHNTIGLVLSDLKNPYFSLIAHGVEEKASDNDYALILSHSSNCIEKEEKQIEKLMDMGVNGLIIASMKHNYTATSAIRKLHEQDFPYVVVSYMSDRDIYHVGTDHELGAFMATDYLINSGYKKISYIGDEQGNILSEVRKLGYLRALNHYEMCYNQSYIYNLPKNGSQDYYNSGRELAKKYLKSSTEIGAFFVYNDLIAIGFEEELLDNGVAVPEDVAIVGFDDIERSEYCRVPLTTVRQPTEKIGNLAVEKLIKKINNEDVEVRTILEPSLVFRGSCRKENGQ